MTRSEIIDEACRLNRPTLQGVWNDNGRQLELVSVAPRWVTRVRATFRYLARRSKLEREIEQLEIVGRSILEPKNRFNHPVFCDAKGFPISGGMLRFFEPGPRVGSVVQTYADPECQIPHTHPIIANQDGEFPAIYFETSGPFRAVFCDAYDEIVQDHSQIFPLVE